MNIHNFWTKLISNFQKHCFINFLWRTLTNAVLFTLTSFYNFFLKEIHPGWSVATLRKYRARVLSSNQNKKKLMHYFSAYQGEFCVTLCTDPSSHTNKLSFSSSDDGSNSSIYKFHVYSKFTYPWCDVIPLMSKIMYAKSML